MLALYLRQIFLYRAWVVWKGTFYVVHALFLYAEVFRRCQGQQRYFTGYAIFFITKYRGMLNSEEKDIDLTLRSSTF